MLSTLFFALVALQSQALEDMVRRQQSEIDRLSKQVQELAKPVCTSEIHAVNGIGPKLVPASAGAVVPINLSINVSKPADNCLPAEVMVTGLYLDSEDNLICSGTVENVAFVSPAIRPFQIVNLDIRPWNLIEFVRWRNEPPERNSGPKRLVCFNPEGTAEATPEELGRVASVRVRANALPKNGGTSTVEVQLRLRR
jgi:hypothetical protein